MSFSREEVGSEEDYEASDSGSRGGYQRGAKMKLRRRKANSQYNEYEDAVGDSEEESDKNPNLKGLRSQRPKISYMAHQMEIDKELDRMDAEHEKKLIESGFFEEGEEEEEFGVFNPDVDQILWRKGSDPKDYQYLVKLKDYSYLHCEWISAEEALSLGKGGKNKVNRFNKMFEQKILEKEIDPERDDNEFFDPSYVKVDRILYTAEMFPVIHSKKANEIKGKWTEYVVKVVSKLLNYSKDKVNYGVCFMEPVNPERDNCPDYRKIVQHPMDLGTLSNRLYLDQYKSYADIWRDLGFVFKNCRLYNQQENSDVRVMGDTLREYARILYKQWHQHQLEKFNQLADEVEVKRRDYLEENPQERQQIEESVDKELKEFVERLNTYFTRGIEIVGRSESERIDRESIKSCKTQLIQEVSLNTVFFGEDSTYMAQLMREIDRLFSFAIGAEGAKNEVIRLQQLITQRVEECRPTVVQHRFDQYLIRKLNLPQSEDINQFNPGEFNYNWLRDYETNNVEDEEFIYFEDEEVHKVDLLSEIDRVYLVKWTNLSYLDATWELESVIDSPSHINEFK